MNESTTILFSLAEFVARITVLTGFAAGVLAIRDARRHTRRGR